MSLVVHISKVDLDEDANLGTRGIKNTPNLGGQVCLKKGGEHVICRGSLGINYPHRQT